MRRRAWGWFLVLPAALFVLVAATAPFTTFHQHLTLSGTPERFAATVVRAGRSNARAALWLDNVFALSWLLVVPRCLRAGLVRWAPERRRLVPLWRSAPTIAVLAGCVDLAENALSLFLVGQRRPPTGITLVVASLTWTKWMLYAAAVAAILALVVGPAVAPVVRPTMRRVFGWLDRLGADDTTALPVADTTPADGPDVGPTIGIAVSGARVPVGSGVALGVLRRFDAARADGPSLLLRARWLVGGAGAAAVVGGWDSTRAVPGMAGTDRAPKAGPGARLGELDAGRPWPDQVEEGMRRLGRSRLAPHGGAAGIVARGALGAVSSAAAAYVAGAALGRAIRTRAIHPAFPYTDRSEQAVLGLRDLVPMRLVLPVVVLLALSALLRRLPRRRGLAPYASAATVGGAVLAVVLLLAPITIRYGRRLLVDVPFADRADVGALVVGAVTLVVFLAGARLWVTRPEAAAAGRLLLGASTTVAVLLVAGKATDTYARAFDGLWVSWPLPGLDARIPVVAIAGLWLLVLATVPQHRLGVFEPTRRTIAATFLPERAPAPATPAPATPARGPLAVVVGAVGSSGSWALRGSSLVVRSWADGPGAGLDVGSLPTGSWWDGFPAAWSTDRWTAHVGRAVGEWVPNPQAVQWFADPLTSPRVHPGMVLGRVLGRHRPRRDAFVHVAGADGEGVVALREMLRDRPTIAFSVGVGDAVRFVERIGPLLGDIGVEVVLDPGVGADPDTTAGLAGADVAAATLRYDDGTSGVLIHGGVAADAAAPVAAGEALADRMVGVFERLAP